MKIVCEMRILTHSDQMEFFRVTNLKERWLCLMVMYSDGRNWVMCGSLDQAQIYPGIGSQLTVHKPIKDMGHFSARYG